MVESSVSPKDDNQAGGFGDILRGKLRVNCGVVNLTVRNAYTIDTYPAKKNRSISCTWPAARAQVHPQILLRSPFFIIWSLGTYQGLPCLHVTQTHWKFHAQDSIWNEDFSDVYAALDLLRRALGPQCPQIWTFRCLCANSPLAPDVGGR